MTKPTMDEQIKALTWLREGWDGDNSERAIEAFETLDNAEVFAEIDEEDFARNRCGDTSAGLPEPPCDLDKPCPVHDRINVTIREVPGGWVALQDDDRSKVVAETILYADLEQRLSKLDRPVYVERVLMVDQVDE